MSALTDNTMGSTRPSTAEEPEPRRDFLTLLGLKSRWSRALGWAVVLLAIVFFPFPVWW
jgi:hypothetical protein